MLLVDIRYSLKFEICVTLNMSVWYINTDWISLKQYLTPFLKDVIDYIITSNLIIYNHTINAAGR